MNILLTGGTGFIGRHLIKLLAGHNITVLTRNQDTAQQTLNHFDKRQLNYIQQLTDIENFDDFDAIINLAGEPIANKRWSKTQKQRICDSRWHLTQEIVDKINQSSTPPSVFISGSAVGYYGHQNHHIVNEQTLADQKSFTHKVCAKWENIALQAQSEQTRVCLLRTGIVLDPMGGALKTMLPPYKLGLGGPIGDGDQFMPWIHLQDMIRGIVYLLENSHAQGAFNFSAPHPVTNKHFSSVLAKTLRRPHILTTPPIMMKLALGEASCLLTDSLRIHPKKLTELGFNFSYSRIEPAMRNLLKQ